VSISRLVRSAGWTAALFAATASLGVAAGCAGSSSIDPSHVELAKDLAPQRELARMRRVWESGDEAARAGLEPGLLRYASAHADDPTSRQAAVMAAVLLVERGELDRAGQLVRLRSVLLAGPTRDMAEVVVGAIERRQGKPTAAFERLEPLFLRVIDGPTRTLLNEELLRAAVEAKRFDRAAPILRAWLREAPKATRLRIALEADSLLDRFPVEPLLAELASERALAEPDPVLSELLSSHLARVAIERQDSALARALLDTAGALLGDRTDAIERVAARGATIRLDRNTVGMLVPRRSEHLERRALDVAAGLAFSLSRRGGRTRLLTRDDAGSLDGVADALVLLQSEGAAVIVAGYDREESDRVAAHALRTGVPVLLLAPPSVAPRPDGPVFVIGEDAASVRARLVEAIVRRGRGPVALLADERGATSLPTTTDVVAVQPCGVPLDFVRTSGARTVLVDGDARCARDFRERAGREVQAAFGLDARDPGPGWLATTGLLDPERPGRASAFADFTASGREPPGWWIALGHDAGALARLAVEAIPERSAVGDAEAQRRIGAAVVRDLATREVDLWSTEARGFGGGRALPRTIELVDRGGRGPTGPR
jgi:hypothetical protein